MFNQTDFRDHFNIEDGIRVTATANANDTGIEGNTVEMTLEFPTGLVVTDRATTSEMFGGNLADI